MIYRIVVEKGEDFGYISHCPAIPGCHSQGETIEEAIENVKDAIRGCIEALDIKLLFENPTPSKMFMEVSV
jgi:predicted RNase H-like HicB family nuclease